MIIPVYNAEAYLEECLESILNQTYPNIEILLIEDGSTDKSRNICMEYAKEHEQVRIFEQDRKGAGQARNCGIKNAVGEYLMFVDADDRLAKDEVVEILVQLMEKEDADIAVGNYQRLWEKELVEANRHGYHLQTDTKTINYRFEGFFSGGILSYVWAKMYRRSFLTEKKICLQKYAYAEDKMFNFECYIEGADYAFTKEDVYIYRKNPNSVSNQYRKDSKENWMAIAKRTDRLLKEKGLQKNYGDLAAHTIFFAVFFDAKQEYIHSGRKLLSVRDTIKGYHSYRVARDYFKKMAKREYIKGVQSGFWRWMLWGFSVAVTMHLYLILALGIKILIDAKVDERLSSTGKQRFGKADSI